MNDPIREALAELVRLYMDAPEDPTLAETGKAWTAARAALAEQPSVRVPLTLAQCRDLVAQHFEHGEMIGDDVTLIRAVEKFHDIPQE